MLTFSDLLRRHRLAAGLSQEALAERAGLSLRGISDLERGARRAPYRDTVLRLAEALDLGDPDRSVLLAASRRQRPGMPTAVSGPSKTALPVPRSSFMGGEHEEFHTRWRALGRSQGQLGAALGVGARTVARSERGVIGVGHPEEPRHAPQRLEGARAASPMPEPVPEATTLVGGTTLPVRPTLLIGRQAALRELRALLSETRLLTLVGPGGVGKTRLALELAGVACADFADGMVFVDLSPAHDPDLVVPLIAQVLDVRDLGGVGLQPALVASIGSRQLLLVLDNFEQVLEAASPVAALLQVCPGLKLVVTSREPLRVSWERRYAVPPLDVPAASDAPPEEVAAVPAVALFVQRARAVQSTFALDAHNALAVSQLCARLDGLPLAIELAAAHVVALPPGLMLQRLGRRLDLLRGPRDQPARHASLRAMLDWSHALLGPEERVLFRRLSIFAGGWSLEAAEAVCAGGALEASAVLDVLARLVERSLVILEDKGGHVRYRLLDTMREYAAEQLARASDDAEALRRRHAQWCLALAEQAAPHIWGPDAVDWLEHLGREHDNLRAALAWSVEAAGRSGDLPEPSPTPAEAGLCLGAALMLFWDLRGQLAEGRTWLERLLALHGTVPAPQAAWASGLFAAGYVALTRGEYDLGTGWLEAAVGLAHTAGLDALRAQALMGLGVIGVLAGRDLHQAERRLRDAVQLSRETGNAYALSASYYLLGEIARTNGNFERARALFRQSLATTPTDKNVWGAAYNLASLGRIALAEADCASARAYQQEGLAPRRDLDDRRGIAFCLEGLAWVAGLDGHGEHAALLFGASAKLHEEPGLPLVPAPEWRAWHERAEEATRGRMGDERCREARAAGRALPRGEAVALALASGSPPARPRPAASGANSRVGAPVLSKREQQVAGLLAAR